MQLYFIRHGQSANNALYARSGSWKGRSHDPDLTEVGQRQARLLAEFLAAGRESPQAGWDPHNTHGFGISHVYASLMRRAAETGSIVAERLGLPLLAWTDIHEGGGIYLEDEDAEDKIGLPGMTRAEFTARFPRLVLPATVGAGGWWNRPYEEPEQRAVRAGRVASDLKARHGGGEDRVALISHGGFYNDFLAALLRMPALDGVWFELSNAGVTRIDFDERGQTLVYQNRVDFLPAEMIT